MARKLKVEELGDLAPLAIAPDPLWEEEFKGNPRWQTDRWVLREEKPEKREFMRDVIFEAETEVGRCRCDRPTARSLEPDAAILFAHTKALRHGRGGLLLVEQHCYLRQGDEIPEQTLVPPRNFLEPAVPTREEMETLARDLHSRYVALAREQIETGLRA